MKDLALMHVDDAHDDKLVAEENALQVHTQAQASYIYIIYIYVYIYIYIHIYIHIILY